MTARSWRSVRMGRRALPSMTTARRRSPTSKSATACASPGSSLTPWRWARSSKVRSCPLHLSAPSLTSAPSATAWCTSRGSRTRGSTTSMSTCRRARTWTCGSARSPKTASSVSRCSRARLAARSAAARRTSPPSSTCRATSGSRARWLASCPSASSCRLRRQRAVARLTASSTSRRSGTASWRTPKTRPRLGRRLRSACRAWTWTRAGCRSP
mmetsp:Transcript_14113/g.29582  ORF Transcript_14113/g.29582 Transcript_14113/m.29582 type:complete len:213 (+) Transcript_14113:509-1147(+)